MTTCLQHQMRTLRRALASVPLVAGLLAGNAMSATLGGQIIHNGPGSGTYYVYVVRLSLDSPVVGHDILNAPGHWSVPNITGGSYFVLAWRDDNGNFIPSRGEPIGFFGDPFPERVTISGQDRSDLDITLQTFNTGAELRGKVTYSGSKHGRIWIVPHLTPTLSLINVRGTPWTQTVPGDYQVFVFTDDTYYVTAYMDVNGNLIYDDGEPIGTSEPVQVHITPGVTYFNVNIDLDTHTTAVEPATWGQVKELFNH